MSEQRQQTGNTKEQPPSSSPAEGLEHEIEKALNATTRWLTSPPDWDDNADKVAAAGLMREASRLLRAALSALREARQPQQPVDTYTPVFWVTLTDDEKYTEYIRARKQIEAAQQRASAAEAQRDALRTQVGRLMVKWRDKNGDTSYLSELGLRARRERQLCADELSALLASVLGLTKEEKAEGSLGNTASGNADAPPSTPSVPGCPICHKPMIHGYHPFGRLWMCNPCGIAQPRNDEAQAESRG